MCGGEEFKISVGIMQVLQKTFRDYWDVLYKMSSQISCEFFGRHNITPYIRHSSTLSMYFVTVCSNLLGTDLNTL